MPASMNPPRHPADARLSLRRKFLMAAVAAALALVVIGAITVMYTRAALSDEVRTQMASIGDLEAERVAREVEATRVKLADAVGDGLLPQTIAFTQRPGPDRRSRLSSAAAILSSSMPSIGPLSIFDANGRVIATSAEEGDGARPRPVDPGLVRAARDSARNGGTGAAVGNAFPSGNGSSRYQHSVVLIDRGQIIGIVVAECSLDSIAEIVQSHERFGATADAHLTQLTSAGAQFITGPRFNPTARWNTIIPMTRTDTLIVRSLSGPNSVIEGLSDYRKVAVVGVTRRISGTPWAMVVKIDRSEAYESLSGIVWAVTVAFLVALLCVGISLAAVYRSVIGRIRRVTESATAISRGDLDARVGDSSRDELGVLAGAFDRMADTLVDDIDRRRRMEAQLEHQTRHDALTELPNRVLFSERLSEALDDPRARPGSVAAIFCDLDEFKAVNDGLGHEAGDVLLQAVAGRFRSALRPGDTLARFGGDEFVVVCRDLQAPDDAQAVATRLMESLADPFIISGREAFVTASIGISINDITSTPDAMVRDADAAMYRAKELGRHRQVTHDAGIRTNSANRLATVTELRGAIGRGELFVAYQPIVDLASGDIVGYEALVRWLREGVTVAPDRFVPLAEQLGLAPALDRFVTEQACRQLVRWRAEGVSHDCRIAVNVSTASLAESAFTESVQSILRETGLEPDALCIEITEGGLAAASEPELLALGLLRSRGLQIAIDDFGTGHSTLARLRDLPVDIVKMDRGFVRDVDQNTSSRTIAAAVLGLAKTLDLAVIAEGIETDGQRRALIELGCERGQGFHFAAARSPEHAREPLVGVG
jgi:diguanylate cyclase (GGDEF)-like protein